MWRNRGHFRQSATSISLFSEKSGVLWLAILPLTILIIASVVTDGRDLYPSKPTGRVNDYGESCKPSEEGTIEVGSH